MQIARPQPHGRYGKRRLDPTRPLYVARRLSSAHDVETGIQLHLVPGEQFNALSVGIRRLESLYASRYLTHDRPRIAAQVLAPAPVDEPAEPALIEVAPLKSKQARGRV